MSRENAHLLPAAEAAAALGVTAATLRDWARRGLLSNYGTARRALYDAEELVAALDAPKPRRLADTPRSTRTA